MTSRRKKAEEDLQTAVEGDLHLDVLKSTRRIISEYLAEAEEPTDRAKFLTLLLKVNADIIKLDGKKEQLSEEDQADYDEIEKMRQFGGDK